MDLFSTILNSAYANQIVTEYIITALMKLTTRLSEPAQIDRVRRLLSANSTSLDVEIQQRAVEYGNLFAYDEIRRGVLEKMPPPEIREEQRVLGEKIPKRKSVIPGKKAKVTKQTESDLLLDLMGGGDLPPTDLVANTNGSSNNADLLADILGDGFSTTSPPPQTSKPGAAPYSSNANAIMDLFGSSGAAATPPPQQSYGSSSADLFGGMSSPAASNPPVSGPTPHHVYNKNDLNITIQLQRNAEGMVQALAKFRNNSNFNRISSVQLQAAVPKTQKLQLQPISNSELDGGQEATQQMRVSGSKNVSKSV